MSSEAYLRYKGVPGRSVLVNAECLWCHCYLSFELALPSSRPERFKVSAPAALAGQHWYDCAALQGCRNSRSFNLRHPELASPCWDDCRCRRIPRLKCWLVESGSGHPVAHVNGKPNRVSRIADRRRTKKPGKTTRRRGRCLDSGEFAPVDIGWMMDDGTSYRPSTAHCLCGARDVPLIYRPGEPKPRYAEHYWEA